MRAQQITANMQIEPRIFERSEEAAICGECAERLIEYAKRIGESSVQKWILMQANLLISDEPSGWFYMRTMCRELNDAVGGVLLRHKDRKEIGHILRNFPTLKIGEAEEINKLFVEMSEIKGERITKKLILRIATLFQTECPRAGWVYLRLATGDLSEVTASHAEHGAIVDRSKQAEHKEHAEALRVIARHYPELATAINELEQKLHKE